MENHIIRLIESIERLIEEEKKTTSFKISFLRGIVFGVGSAIGASIIAAILISSIIKFFQEAAKNIF